MMVRAGFPADKFREMLRMAENQHYQDEAAKYEDATDEDDAAEDVQAEGIFIWKP